MNTTPRPRTVLSDENVSRVVSILFNTNERHDLSTNALTAPMAAKLNDKFQPAQIVIEFEKDSNGQLPEAGKFDASSIFHNMFPVDSRLKAVHLKPSLLGRISLEREQNLYQSVKMEKTSIELVVVHQLGERRSVSVSATFRLHLPSGLITFVD